jgi:peptidyl-prolyl cis-trans isomerase B (cyclophilin B)
MKRWIILFFTFIPVLIFAQSKTTKCDSITCDYVVKIQITYPDSVPTGDCIKMIKDEIVVILYDKTPKHKANFIKLAKEGFFNGSTFHRVIDGFMIQGGDPNSKDNNPNNDGQGGPGYTIPAEINPDLKHQKGAVAGARLPDHMNPNRESNGSQFYIIQNNTGTPHLDGGYTVFGQVIKGLNVVDRIAKVKKGQNDRPIYDVKMTVSVEQISKKRITELYGYHYQ